MKVPRLLLPLLTAAALVVPLAAVAPAPAAATTPPVLVDVRAAHHTGFDRVVFDFRGGLPASRHLEYVDQLTGDGSGLPVRIAGRAILSVSFEGVDAHDATGSTAPHRVAFPLPNVMTAVQSGDFEGHVSYGLGLARRATVHSFTLTSPPRVVVDVAATFPTVSRRVWLFNQANFLANRAPFYTPVLRPVPTTTPATGVMDRLFAGPTPTERAAGLRLLRSRAFSWTALSISTSAVARVRLTGGCSSGGSTVTIAGEIKPSLRQFASVDWVKIYDPSGHTEHPTGLRDSIPACLEP